MTSTSTREPVASDLGDGITQIRLPMAGNPLRSINGYLLEDDGGPTLVDCGWRTPDVEQTLRDALAERGLQPADLARLLITHHHYDHYGLAGTLRRAGVPALFMHRLDWDRARLFAVDPAAIEARSTAWLARNGYAAAPDDADFDASRTELTEPTHLLDGGERIGRLTAIWTPGHAPGHLCFADARSGRVLTGDHVLDPITPHVGIWVDQPGDPFGDYLDSLEAIAAYGETTALPAQGEPFPGLAARARAIASHGRQREQLMLAAVAAGARTAGAVARAVPWTRRERPFEALSPFHREFAVTETIAHLEHLRVTGSLVRDGNEPIRYIPG